MHPFLARMRRDWDARARENAREVIATGMADPYMFALSGLHDAHTILHDVFHLLSADSVVLEIGCGIGRILTYLAHVFRRVIGIDVSPEMIARSKDFLSMHRNVETLVGDGCTLAPLADDSVDFAFSYVVFQHIPSKEVIRSYVREVRRVLRPGGVFKFLVKHTPWRTDGHVDTWHGVDVDERDVEQWRAENGFDLLNRYSLDAHVAWIVFRAPSA